MRSQVELRLRAPGGDEASGTCHLPATLDVARKARAIFDLAHMSGDPRRLKPCPGFTPPKRVMHRLHPVAADHAVRALAVLCRQEEALGREVDRMLALRNLLQHVGGALPCSAADPYPQSQGFDRDATACSKCRKDYETAPFCHFRPVTKERPGTESDTRRQAAKRVMGPSAILGQLQVLSLLALLVQKYKY